MSVVTSMLISCKTTLLSTLAVLCMCAPAFSQDCVDPPNEDCDGAIEFTFSELPFTYSGILACDNFMVDRPYFDVFFKHVCTQTGEYTFDMCDSTGDSYMHIYIDGCGFGPASSWVEDDDGCGAFPGALDPKITITLTEGTTYFMELGAWRADSFFPPNANDPYTFNVVLEVEPILGDINNDGVVNVTDLLAVIDAWGPCQKPCPPICEADTNDDCIVDVNDVLTVVGNWG